MSDPNTIRPIIIKRKKVVAGGGHHGGAWKVAYADFVTAMMAFFLLMWLLNATTEKQRKGLADYFNPTIAVNRISGGGDGAFNGDSIFTEETLTQSGTGASAQTSSNANAAADASPGDKRESDEGFMQVQALLEGDGTHTINAPDSLRRHINARVTDEGLIVEIFDLEGAPLFYKGGAEPTPLLEALADMLGEAFALISNDATIGGHTRSRPIVLTQNPVWDLSTTRAQKMRILLEGAGFEDERVQRVSGWADRRPTTANPMALRNNRLEIVLLRSHR